MVVSLNSALISKNNSNIAFGNSHKNSAKLTPQVSDEFVTKGIKQAKSPLRNFIRATLLTLGMGAAMGPTMTSCHPINPPIDPKDTTVVVDPKLSPIERKFNNVMGPVLAIDSIGKVDSLAVQDNYAYQVLGFKADVVKSSNDTLVFNRSVTSVDGFPITNFVSKFFVDKNDGILTDYQYSKGKLYGVRKYRPSADGVIESLTGEDFYKYKPKSLGEALKYNIVTNSDGKLVKLLYKSVRK